jgi:RecB family endonuclease NucS
MAKFFNTVEVAGRSYKRWSVTGTFSTDRNIAEKYKDKFYVAPGDIVRWHSNNQIPFGDILLDFAEALLITPKQVRKSCELKEKETNEFWKKLGEKL